MDIRRLLCNVVGVGLGGGLMYALVKKAGYEKSAKTLSSVIVEGGAITGAAFLGYHLSNLVANHLLPQDAVEKLPSDQVTSLPSGDTPVETPTSTTAMGNVAAREKAVTPSVSAADVKGGQVIDISTGMQKSEG